MAGAVGLIGAAELSIHYVLLDIMYDIVFYLMKVELIDILSLNILFNYIPLVCVLLYVSGILYTGCLLVA